MFTSVAKARAAASISGCLVYKGVVTLVRDSYRDVEDDDEAVHLTQPTPEQH